MCLHWRCAGLSVLRDESCARIPFLNAAPRIASWSAKGFRREPWPAPRRGAGHGESVRVLLELWCRLVVGDEDVEQCDGVA